MRILRIVAGVVVGYVVFAVGSMLLVGPVMSGEGASIVVLGLVWLALVGLISGFVAAAISGADRGMVGCILSGLVALATLANLLMGLGAEPNWYKVGTLVLTAPAIFLVSSRLAGAKKTG